MIIKRFVSLFSTTSFKVIAFLVLFITSLMIALAMLLGKEAGNFVIRVQDGVSDKSISLSVGDPNDSSSWTSKLEAQGITGMTDYTAEYFVKFGYSDLDVITADTGSWTREGNSLYSYTFYIVNTSPSGNVGVNLTLNYSNVSEGVDKAIRVLTYARTSSQAVPEIYMAKDDTTKYEVDDNGVPVNPYSEYIIAPQNFASEDGKKGVVFRQNYIIGQTASEASSSKDAGNYLKYSVFFWLEGKDPDCDEDILGGTIKFDLTVAVAA